MLSVKKARLHKPEEYQVGKTSKVRDEESLNVGRGHVGGHGNQQQVVDVDPYVALGGAPLGIMEKGRLCLVATRFGWIFKLKFESARRRNGLSRLKNENQETLKTEKEAAQVMDMQENNDLPRQVVEASLNDQRFLLNFIMGTFLGPDVKTDIPRRSAAQRMTEGLPLYGLNDLGSSFVTLPQVENLYYYILRHAHPSAVLKLHSLYIYFKGKLSSGSWVLEDTRQFTSFFPLNLHKQNRYKGSHKVQGAVLIDNPDTSYIKLEDLERFRYLTGMHDIKINMGELQLYPLGYRTDKEESEQDKISKGTAIEKVPTSSGSARATAKLQVERKKRSRTETLPQLLPKPIRAQHPIEVTFSARTCELGGPSMVSLSSSPKLEQWNSNSSIILTGTAKERRAGPAIGLVDIGTNRDAYLFRVALPGVKKDQGQFSCEIEHDGKVHIQGVTMTGEGSILRHSRLFQMKTQNLCPPGPFTISFRLPGPVDPRLFSPDFRSDGILEAVVMKYRIPGA
ncbi:hypothetical protein NE237_018461 [Protea cynaroides]|uniref:Uncharacterized protein n=1 Tax=Protea cynaroides TaxID=273540 RepID=A0A9Q0QP06_9MAGN|nr:hypothetical protein NE237_018461 [Protea cynaroides]